MAVIRFCSSTSASYFSARSNLNFLRYKQARNVACIHIAAFSSIENSLFFINMDNLGLTSTPSLSFPSLGWLGLLYLIPGAIIKSANSASNSLSTSYVRCRRSFNFFSKYRLLFCSIIVSLWVKLSFSFANICDEWLLILWIDCLKSAQSGQTNSLL